MKYKFRDGYSVKGVSAEAAADELTRIYQSHGELAASVLVKESEPKDAPLHPAFTWDNKKAAHEYRLIQARTVIRAVTVVAEDKSESPAYVHVRVEERKGEGAYHPLDVVVRDDDLYVEALTTANQRVQSAQAALAALEQAAHKTDNPERLAKLAIAVRSLEVASEAIRAMH